MPATDHVHFQGVICEDCRGLVMCWPKPESEAGAQFLRDVMREHVKVNLRDMTRAAVLALPRCDCIVPGFVAGPTDSTEGEQHESEK